MHFRKAMKCYLAIAILVFTAIEMPSNAHCSTNIEVKIVDLREQVENHYAAGKYIQAEVAAKKAIALIKHPKDERNQKYVDIIERLALIKLKRKEYDDAEALFRRVIQLRENTYGGQHALVARALDGLANVMWDQGKKREAMDIWRHGFDALSYPLANRSIVKEDPDKKLEQFALTLKQQGKLEESEKAYRRLILSYERRGLSQSIALPLEALAEIVLEQGRHEEAFGLHQRLMNIWREAWGTHHVLVGYYSRYARLYARFNRYEQEEKLLKAALDISEKVSGMNHLETIALVSELGRLFEKRKQHQQAFREYSRAAKALSNQLIMNTVARQGSTVKLLSANVFHDLIRVGYILDQSDPMNGSQYKNSAFTSAQLVNLSSAATALSQMSARFSTGSTDLSYLIRKLQDLQQQWRALNQQLIKEISDQNKQPKNGIYYISADLQLLENKIAELNKRISSSYPKYVHLSNPRTISITEAQAALNEDEVLIQILIGEAESFVWVVTKDGVGWNRLFLGSDYFSEKVNTIRCGVIYSPYMKHSKEGQKCTELLNIDINNLSDNDVFPFGVAHELYSKLFGPFHNQIAGKSLLINLSGALASIPLHVLIEKLPNKKHSIPDRYRSAKWFGLEHSYTMLPVISSLQIDAEKKTAGSKKQFIGFGDPILRGNEGCTNRGDREFKSKYYYRGSLADVDALNTLCPLPDTKDELITIAKDLNVSDMEVYLGRRATETKLKHIDLSQYRIIQFATHGLIARETQDLARGPSEPALVLTPPVNPSVTDDGLLTASEIAQLKLDADWVILSACNTAVGKDVKTDSLSGLARSFFYAGARALLVSHWAVDSPSASILTKGIFANANANPKISRAEALRRAMVDFMRQDNSLAVYPRYWAPFVVVGINGK